MELSCLGLSQTVQVGVQTGRIQNDFGALLLHLNSDDHGRVKDFVTKYWG